MERLFADHADLYDRIYSSKPYADEAALVRELLTAEGIEEGETVLEAACGTGSYLRELRHWYDVTGFDISEAMLRECRKKLPQVSVFNANLETFTVERPVSAVVCLFGSIAYLRTREALSRAARSCFEAIRSGGVVVVEPFYSAQSFRAGRPSLASYDGEGLKVARVVIPAVVGPMAMLDFNWLVAREGTDEVEHFVERHELRLGDLDELADVFDSARFQVQLAPNTLRQGQQFVVGRKL